jgi:hypothetical protein
MPSMLIPSSQRPKFARHLSGVPVFGFRNKPFFWAQWRISASALRELPL